MWGRLSELMRRVARLEEDSGAGSSEGFFFDNPDKRSVREFVESRALTNEKDVSEVALDCYDLAFKSQREERRDLLRTPNTPNENLEKPGSKEFSTLNRFVVKTEQPSADGLPDGYDEIPKATKEQALKTAMRRMGYVHR